MANENEFSEKLEDLIKGIDISLIKSNLDRRELKIFCGVMINLCVGFMRCHEGNDFSENFLICALKDKTNVLRYRNMDYKNDN